MSRIADTQRISAADELFAMPDDGHRYDLRYGVLHRMSPPGFRHGTIASRFDSLLRHYVEGSRSTTRPRTCSDTEPRWAWW